MSTPPIVWAWAITYLMAPLIVAPVPMWLHVVGGLAVLSIGLEFWRERMAEPREKM